MLSNAVAVGSMVLVSGVLMNFRVTCVLSNIFLLRLLLIRLLLLLVVGFNTTFAKKNLSLFYINNLNK